MNRHVSLAVFVAAVFLPVAAVAECIAPNVRDTKKRATLVFEGTVTRIVALDYPQFAATLNVHRVWKGELPRETTVYYRPTLDGPFFEEGKRIVVFAQPLTAAAIRKDHSMPPNMSPRNAFVHPCSGTWPADEAVVKKLGRWRKPSATR